MRQAAEWMSNPSDDRILEALREHGQLTPQAIDKVGGPAANTCRNRLPTLRSYGVVRLYAGTTGLYEITDDGIAYLDEELDASTLTKSDGD